MESSSPFASAPSSRSPSPFGDDVDGSIHSLHDDAQTLSSTEEALGDIDGTVDDGVEAPCIPTAKDIVARSLKGKEKARKGPLRFLDLPVDILKEIIYQVGSLDRK